MHRRAWSLDGVTTTSNKHMRARNSAWGLGEAQFDSQNRWEPAPLLDGRGLLANEKKICRKHLRFRVRIVGDYIMDFPFVVVVVVVVVAEAVAI